MRPTPKFFTLALYTAAIGCGSDAATSASLTALPSQQEALHQAPPPDPDFAMLMAQDQAAYPDAPAECAQVSEKVAAARAAFEKTSAYKQLANTPTYKAAWEKREAYAAAGCFGKGGPSIWVPAPECKESFAALYGAWKSVVSLPQYLLLHPSGSLNQLLAAWDNAVRGHCVRAS